MSFKVGPRHSRGWADQFAEINRTIVGVDRTLNRRVDQLDEKIDGVEDRLQQQITALDQKIDGVETRLTGHIADAATHTADVVTKALGVELARHTQAITESVRADIRILDEKYQHLRERPTQLVTISMST